MQLLLIKLSSLTGIPEYALLGKKQAEDRFTPSDWGKIRSLTRGRRVVLLLANNEIVLSTTNIPSKNKKQLAQAVPYALEESLADDIDNLHFSIHTLNNKDKKSDKKSAENKVAIINRERFSQYLDKLSEAHIPVHFVLPQLFTLEHHQNSWTLQVDNENAQIRSDEFSGFSCDSEMLALFLPEQLEKHSPETIYSNLSADEIPASLQDIPLKESHDLGLVKRDSIISALPLNLLNGFVRNTKAFKFNFKPWKPAFVLGSLLGVIWLGILSWQNHLLSKQSFQLDTAITKVYKKTFPTSRIVDPPQQMASQLKQLQSGTTEVIQSPLPLIASIGPLLTNQKDISLQEIRYQENALHLVVLAPNLSQLESFKKEAAEKTKLNIVIKSSTTTANKVEATLVINAPKEGSA